MSQWHEEAAKNGILAPSPTRHHALDLNPLKVAGKTATVYQDGPNAETFAEDWAMKEVRIPADGKLQVHLAPGGGVAIKI